MSSCRGGVQGAAGQPHGFLDRGDLAFGRQGRIRQAGGAVTTNAFARQGAGLHVDQLGNDGPGRAAAEAAARGLFAVDARRDAGRVGANRDPVGGSRG